MCPMMCIQNNFLLQLVADMEWLLEGEDLRATAASTWKTLTPKVLLQAKLEAVHNSRLHSITSRYEISEDI